MKTHNTQSSANQLVVDVYARGGSDVGAVEEDTFEIITKYIQGN